MVDKKKIDLGEIQETLLFPLYGRALDARSRRPLLGDARAAELVGRVEYDFSRFDGERALFGAVLRTALFDEWVKAFLAEHPAGTIVEMGAGLNTRFERLDNRTARWLEVDLPDAMEVRKAFFQDHERRTLLAASIDDDAWVTVARCSPGPYFIVIEAVLMYLDESLVKNSLERIAHSFPGARVALDVAGTWMVENQIRQRAIRNIRARFRWACDDPREIERWGLGLSLVETRTLVDVPDALRARLSWLYLLVARTLLRKRINAYTLALFEASKVPR